LEKIKARQIFEAVKKDDLKSFSSLLTEPSDLNVCFGKFPLLSVMYLFESWNILSVYEARLLRVSKFEFQDEFFEIYERFKRKAKKSLRLFLNGDLICYPVLMLAVLDNRKLLEINYKNLYKTVEIVNILNKIYILNMNLETNITTDKFDVPRKKQTTAQKLRTCFVSIVLVIVIFLSVASIAFIGTTTGIGTSGLPILIATESEMKEALAKGKKYYKLTSDIELETDESVKIFSGTIDGNGHTLTLKNVSSSLLQHLSGTIQNIKIFAELSNFQITQDFAVLAEYSTGIIKNTEISLKIDGTFLVSEDTYVSVFVVSNTGVIENSKSYLSANVSNEGQTNCYLTGFVGENSGKILNSETLEAEVSSDTVDMAGFAISNSGTISRCTNNLKLSQTSSKEWHPNTAGIAVSNYGLIELTKNLGEISSESTYNVSTDNTFLVLAGGISCDNSGEISNSRNFGNITASGMISNTYSAGIVAMNGLNEYDSTKVTLCKSKGSILSKTKTGQAFAGGIVGLNWSTVSNSGFEGEIAVDSENFGMAGGIVGDNKFWILSGFNFVGNGSVSNSYTQVKFSYIDASHSSNIRYGAIAGILETSTPNIPFSNNHYVKDSSFIYAAWLGTTSGLEDTSAGATSYQKLEDIDSEVVLDDEI
jgi:hypothetical protein